MNKKIILGAIIIGGCTLTSLYINNNTPEANTPTNYIDFKIDDTNTTEYVNEVKNVVYLKKKTTKKKTKKKTTKKKSTKKLPTSYKLTHYGYDCKGCGGKTATGYNIKKTIYYNDYQYGKVRIVAMCSSMPLYSIIKIKNYKMGGDVIAIVIDRGVGCGTIDLAVKNEKTSSRYGIQKNVKIEVLRYGRN